MLRSQKFRQQLFSQKDLSENGDSFFAHWQMVKTKIPYHSLEGFEKAALFLFILSALRRPTDFFGGPHSHSLPQIKGTLKVGELKEFAGAARSFLKISDEMSFLEVILQHSFRSIPYSVQRSLTYWGLQKYPLILLHRIPSPEEVLDLQCQGQRVVSLLDEPHHFTGFVENDRDTLGFLVHDLIHADHFFFDPENAKNQIYFCRLLKNLLAVPEFKNLVDHNREFEKDFHYLASDMNSVTLHLFKSLKAILLKAYKNERNTPAAEKLSATHEADFHHFIDRLFAALSWKEDSRGALRRLNSPEFKIERDYLLLIKNLC